MGPVTSACSPYAAFAARATAEAASKPRTSTVVSMSMATVDYRHPRPRALRAWAWQQPAEAYKTYFNILQLGGGSAGLYAKWLRLGLQQRAYEKLSVDGRGELAQALNA